MFLTGVYIQEMHLLLRDLKGHQIDFRAFVSQGLPVHMACESVSVPPLLHGHSNKQSVRVELLARRPCLQVVSYRISTATNMGYQKSRPQTSEGVVS